MIKFEKDTLRYSIATTSINSDIIARISPFHNCQNFSIASFGKVLTDYDKESIKTATNFLIELRKTWGKPYCVIDISESVYKNLKNAISEGFKVEFVVEAPYVNATSSYMVLCILDLSYLEIIE